MLLHALKTELNTQLQLLHFLPFGTVHCFPLVSIPYLQVWVQMWDGG